ncbi:MAG: 1-acyl-sn-glycerol-3-phosphate acyltransferase [Pseudomonadales bacterium]|nr:1-acyl-sn-glycerol-3-phosphate acyltransferase [Pseudomonadales bacterium]NRA18689.1 1-acyl-sn-glycerol-3-phosphate acyltransferase [Oceanospirillaceae bacterium]
MSLIGKLLNKLFVSAKILGDEHLRISTEVIYVLETSRSEHLALLNLSLREKGAQVAHRCLLSADSNGEKALLYRLESLIEKLEFSERNIDVKIVPVTLYHGHFPNRESSWWRVVFSERWGPKGWWSRLLHLLINGRKTLLQLDSPFSLKALMHEGGLQPSGAEAVKIVKMLQRHFNQRRTATFGPDLSNRKRLLEKIINQDDIQSAIELYAEQKQLSFGESEKYARQQLRGIAANLSPSFVRWFSSVLGWFFRRTYRQVKIQGVDAVRQIAKDYQVVFLPCHRSHMDYVLLSWSLHNQGLMLPHVVAGDNLNAPILGGALKLGGAVFMRRSFYDDPLYGALFKSYIKQLHGSGHALEYFIEGGRSRTGRLLPAKSGVLAMTLQASLQEGGKPIAVVPVWISYDKLVESRSYAQQLANGQKKPESLSGLLQSLKLFKGKFGDAVISYAKPIVVNERFSKFDNLKVSSNLLARQVMEDINGACYVNETALLATVLLATHRLRLTREQLIERVGQLSSVLVKMPNAPAGIAKGSVGEWIDMAEARGQLSVSSADVYLTAEQACEMTFYRNQIHHLTLLVGLYLLVAKRYPKPLVQTVPKLIKGVYPHLAKELYWPWQGVQITKALREIRELLVSQQLLIEDKNCLQVRNTAVSVALMQTVEPYLLRYYIVFKLLQEYRDLTVTDLVDESVRLASLLHVEFGFHSPEYTDPKSIDRFIKAMQEQQVLAVKDGAIYACVDTRALMVRSKQVLLKHYLETIEVNIRPK